MSGVVDILGGARWDVRHGDAAEVLRGLPDACIDSVVVDPPYGLSSHDRLVPEILRAWLDGSDAADVASRLRGFMGREWDALPPSPVTWREVLRVLKPGGHCLAFGGARTSHLVAIGLQLAGFEIRDAIEVSGLVSAAHLLWVQSQGFPKSLAVGRAIDDAAGAVREVVGHSPDAAVRQPGRAMNPGGLGMCACADERAITAPATPEAAAWEGWGTALSPAQEPVVVARKPLGTTVADCVLTHGTGALNIDACRVPTTQADRDLMASRSNPHGTRGGANGGAVLMQFDKPEGFNPSPQGRWPSNFALVHAPSCTPADCAPDCPVRAIGEQSGERVSRWGAAASDERPRDENRAAYGNGLRAGAARFDAGNASRFFPSFRYTDADTWPFRYVPKASRAERERGCERLPAKPPPKMDGGEWTNPDSPGALGNKTTRCRNHHPCVKPIEALRWLSRLSCPPGGLILDPFCGSGSGGCAALAEGFRFLGIERDASYVEIARARLRATAARPLGYRAAPDRATQLDLLGGAP